MTVLWVLKSIDVMSATYTAYGLAYFIEQIFASENVSITIQDTGYAYQLQIDREAEIIIEKVRKNGLPLLLHAIFKLSSSEKNEIDRGNNVEQIRRKYIPAGYPNNLVVDYPALREQKRSAGKQKPIMDSLTQVTMLNYPLYDLLCVGFVTGILMSVVYPLLVHTWYAHTKDVDIATKLMSLILDLYTHPKVNNRELAVTWVKTIKVHLDYPDFRLFRWRKRQSDITLSSLIATSMSKGQNLVKANRRKQDDSPKVFWLEVFFAFVGFMTVAMPFRAKGNGRKPDIVIFYPCFNRIEWNSFRKLVSLCRKYIRENDRFYISSKYSYEKLSVLLFLDLYRAMLSLDDLFTRNDPQLVLVTTSYKFMISNHVADGSAVYKLFSYPKLPNQDSEKSLVQLQKLQSELASIDDTYSERIAVFRNFLAYLEDEDLKAWIRFMLYFTDYRLKTISSPPWFPHISEFFEELKQMSSERQDYRPIIQDPGLKDIAKAINFCSVKIAYRKQGKKVASAFKIHYGIGFELLRSSHDSEIFLRAVSSFIHEYTNESLSVFLATREVRSAIPATAFESIVNLVSLYGSDMVAHILVGLAFSSHFEKSESKSSVSTNEGEEL